MEVHDWGTEGEMWGQGQVDLGEFVSDDMELFGLQPEWEIFRDVWREKNSI